MNVDLLSISGIHTRMAVREADVVMDLGLADEAAMRCNTALLTHLHADHASATWTWAAQGAFRYEGPRAMVCHEAVLDQLQAFLEAGRIMNGGEDELPTLIGVAPGRASPSPRGAATPSPLGPTTASLLAGGHWSRRAARPSPSSLGRPPRSSVSTRPRVAPSTRRRRRSPSPTRAIRRSRG